MMPSCALPLQSLESIREQCKRIMKETLRGKGLFEIDTNKMDKALEIIENLIVRDYGPLDSASIAETIAKIPEHSRWRHFPLEEIENLKSHCKGDGTKFCMALLDLFTVSVLMDAGAGDEWKWIHPRTGTVFVRSEGLAMATLEMFRKGMFSDDSQNHLAVTADALCKLELSAFEREFQCSEGNMVQGLRGRIELLHKLGNEIKSQPSYFPSDPNGTSKYLRPANIYVFLKTKSDENGNVDIDVLWKIIIDVFGKIWPTTDRLIIDGVAMGDVWQYPLKTTSKGLENTEIIQVPFHKLSQWLTYSLIEPMQNIGKLSFLNKSKMTTLAEYRNGGYLIDCGLLVCKDEDYKIKRYNPKDPLIVEWRALTIILIDQIHAIFLSKYDLSSADFPLPKLLEAGTWKAGRELASKLRPSSMAPPIQIISDGATF